MNRFFRLLAFAKPYWPLALLNVLFNILTNILGVVSIAMIYPFLQLLFNQVKIPETNPGFHFSLEGASNYFNFEFGNIIKEAGKNEALLWLCIFVIIIFLAKNFFRYMALYVASPFRSGIIRDLRNALYSKILFLPISYFSDERKGDLIARMTTDVQEIEWSVLSFLEAAFREPVSIIVSFVFLFFISAKLTLIVLCILPIAGIIIGLVGRSLRKQSLRGQNKLGYLMSLIDETLGGMRVVKGFNAEERMSKRFTDENQSYFKLLVSMLRRRDLSSPLSEFLGIGAVVCVLLIGGRIVLSEESSLSAAGFISFIVIFSQVINPAKSFTNAFYNIQRGMASTERVEKILDAEITIHDEVDAISISRFENKIEYRDVNFSYSSETVLDQVNVEIKKGMMVAIVGPSGAGKSTMVDLLPRFHDVSGGEILVDDVAVKKIKLHDLRALLGIVTQEPVLFNDTVFNNIAFGKPGASKEEVMAAAKIANAHEFIMKMESGYETNIGDRGNKCSGGERQRLTIARAILKNPPILILDEATSALDTENERLVQEALSNLMENRTSLVIAHRLTTIQHADLILVMREGKIIQRGKHSRLMQEEGLYRRLVELQQF